MITIDGISYNVDVAKNSAKQEWINARLDVVANIPEDKREAYLSEVYDRLTQGEATQPRRRGQSV